jgi:pimeloyl-ACP methyl ester carboxylesterase
MIQLGCIADDFTGATDLAGSLAPDGGLRLHMTDVPQGQSAQARHELAMARSSQGDGSVPAPALPCLLMLPGTLCDRRVFARQQRALRGQARVLAIDYAELGPPQRWIDTLLQRLPPRFSVAGFSLGGLCALELLRRAPERVERIAMIASNAQPASAAGRRKSAWLRRMWLERGPGEVARHVKPAYFHHEASRRRHARLVHAMALGTPRRTAFEQFRWAAQRPDGLSVLSAFGGPLLVVSGARDALCPPHWQQAMVLAQPRARWLELPRVGHFVPLEAPVRLSMALQRWMSEPPAFSAARRP